VCACEPSFVCAACRDTPRDDRYLDDQEAERNAFADGRSMYEPGLDRG
jgi:hypothetical protein